MMLPLVFYIRFYYFGLKFKTLMTMKPLILVSPLYDDERESLWMLPQYLKCIREAGGWTLTLDLCADDDYVDEVVSLASGILLTGGHDVNPSLYGEAMLPTCGTNVDTRDQLEMRLLNKAFNHDIPLLGICRGMQLMNVFFGGALMQDIPTEAPTIIEHHMAAPYNRNVHDINIDTDSLLYRIMGRETLGVNSYHHQGIKRLATGLTSVATSFDGMIEAVEHQGRSFMMGIQWHPEFFVDEPDKPWHPLFKAFVDASASKLVSR